MKQPSEMTNQELNEALAVEVKGWHKLLGFWYNESDEIQCEREDWNPAEDLNQAVECAKKETYALRIDWCVGGEPTCSAWVWFPVENLDGERVNAEYMAIAESPARALSEAVLMAKRGEE